MQRQQHEADADKGRPETLAGIRTAGTVQNHADKDHERRQPLDAGRNDPGGHGGSDIGAEEHDLRHARAHEPLLHEGSGHQGGGRRTLQGQRRHKAGRERAHGPVGSLRETGAQARTEGACHAILDERQAEEQQCDRSKKIDHHDCRLHGMPSCGVFRIAPCLATEPQFQGVFDTI
ncbi:hypothetical protein D9M68_345050 [compost metagenome]